MSPDTVIKAERLSKKYCRSLRRSLWYGIQDMGRELNPLPIATAPTERRTLRAEEFWAVDDVSFSLRKGECLGLIGLNGAGKTTLLKVLNGLLKPDSGSVQIAGRVGALIALGAGFNPVLTGRENIYVGGAVLGLSRSEIEEKFDDITSFADLGGFLDSPVQSYSSGMAVRLGFAIASCMTPDVLLLDEVLAVGDMGFQAKCFNRLSEIRRKGTASILVSHNMHHITRFCDQVLYLERGRVIYSGPARAGVEMLLNNMMQGNPGGGAGGSSHKQEESGSLAVAIEDAYFEGEGGGRAEEIHSGETVSLVMRYRGRRVITNPLIELVLRDQMGDVWLHVSNQIAEFKISELGHEGVLKVRFPQLPANNQALTLSIAIWDTPSHDLLYWSRGLKLKVLGHASSTGKVLFATKWIHEPATTVH